MRVAENELSVAEKQKKSRKSQIVDGARFSQGRPRTAVLEIALILGFDRAGEGWGVISLLARESVFQGVGEVPGEVVTNVLEQ